MRIRDPGWKKFGFRDGKNSDPGSRTNIPDPQHWWQGKLPKSGDAVTHNNNTGTGKDQC